MDIKFSLKIFSWEKTLKIIVRQLLNIVFLFLLRENNKNLHSMACNIINKYNNRQNSCINIQNIKGKKALVVKVGYPIP